MYSIGLAYLLWFLSGFGALGFHRFYLGKIGTGLIWLLTGGLFMVGAVYDFFTLPMQVRDANMRERYREAMYFEKKKRRKMRRDSIEQIILSIAKRNHGIVAPSEVALEAEIPIKKARKHLEDLAENGYADLQVSKSGAIVFVIPDFRRDRLNDEFETLY
jgi:predicted transcriptional regulator